MLVAAGSPKLADLDANGQRASVRAMIAAMMQAKAEAASKQGGDAPLPPDPAPPARRGGFFGRLFGRNT
jgi:hypothetical protein